MNFEFKAVIMNSNASAMMDAVKALSDSMSGFSADASELSSDILSNAGIWSCGAATHFGSTIGSSTAKAASIVEGSLGSLKGLVGEVSEYQTLSGKYNELKTKYDEYDKEKKDLNDNLFELVTETKKDANGKDVTTSSYVKNETKAARIIELINLMSDLEIKALPITNRAEAIERDLGC